MQPVQLLPVVPEASMSTAFHISLPEDMLQDTTVINGQKYWMLMHLPVFKKNGIFNKETARSFRKYFRKRKY